MLFSPFCSYANDYKQEAIELFKQSKELESDHLADALDIQSRAQETITNTFCKEDREIVKESLINRTSGQNSGREQYYVFISLSMPESSLKTLYNEAKDQKAILVLRGLYEDSFRRTADKLKTLQIVAVINPNLFKQYQVSKAPTFVLVNGEQSSMLVGNVTFQFASEKLQEAMK